MCVMEPAPLPGLWQTAPHPGTPAQKSVSGKELGEYSANYSPRIGTKPRVRRVGWEGVEQCKGAGK